MTYTNFNPNGYPYYAFPAKAREAFEQIAENSQTPFPLIGGEMLVTMAYGSQARVRVRRRPGLVTNVCLNALTISESGERKSAVDGLLTQSIRDVQHTADSRFSGHAPIQAVEQEIYAAKRSALITELREAVREGDDTSAVEEQLHELLTQKPKTRRAPRLVYGDTTVEALLQNLHESWPSAILLAAEGGLFLEGHMTRRINVINMLTTGEPIFVDRKTSESFVVKDAKASISVMVQPDVFDRFRRRKDESARGSGMWARFLVSRPLSTQGSRFILAADQNWQHVDAFNQRIREMIEDLEQPGRLLTPRIRELGLDPDAQVAWTNFYNAVEAQLVPWGYLADVRDYGSRISEHVAKIAAIFHDFQGLDGDVKLDSMERAIEFGKWYLQEFVSIFGDSTPQDALVDDALKLHQHLNLMVMRTARLGISKSSLRQRGPLRDRARLQDALDLMTARGMVMPRYYGRTLWIELNPVFFGGPMPAAAGQAQLTPVRPALPFGGTSL